jgi:hypothetical protein
MRVSFAGPGTKTLRASDFRFEATAAPLQRTSKCQDESEPQPPQRAKFRNMVNMIRAVNGFKTEKVLSDVLVL